MTNSGKLFAYELINWLMNVSGFKKKIPNVYFPSEETEPFCAGNYAQPKIVPGNHPISYSGFN